MPPRQDCYKVLGVSFADDMVIIKKAYTAKALKSHPDKTKDKTLQEQQDLQTEFIVFQGAWETLKDPERKKEHDLLFKYVKSQAKKTTTPKSTKATRAPANPNRKPPKRGSAGPGPRRKPATPPSSDDSSSKNTSSGESTTKRSFNSKTSTNSTNSAYNPYEPDFDIFPSNFKFTDPSPKGKAREPEKAKEFEKAKETAKTIPASKRTRYPQDPSNFDFEPIIPSHNFTGSSSTRKGKASEEEIAPKRRKSDQGSNETTFVPIVPSYVFANSELKLSAKATHSEKTSSQDTKYHHGTNETKLESITPSYNFCRPEMKPSPKTAETARGYQEAWAFDPADYDEEPQTKDSGTQTDLPHTCDSFTQTPIMTAAMYADSYSQTCEKPTCTISYWVNFSYK